MPSAAFFACASFILAWPLAAASLAISVAAVACAFTLSSSPIGRLPFLAPSSNPSCDPAALSATGRASGRAVHSPHFPGEPAPGTKGRTRGPSQVFGAAETSVVEVVVDAFLGSVLVGTEVVVVVEDVCDRCVVVVVAPVFFEVFLPLTGGAVVVVVVAAPGVVVPITSCACAIACCI